MTGFRLFTSNRMEILFESLAQVLKNPLPNPLEQEIIVVQSKGMERWISMRLAQKFGIWGNDFSLGLIVYSYLGEKNGEYTFLNKAFTVQLTTGIVF